VDRGGDRHEESIPAASALKLRGWAPRPKVLTTLMRTPQQGQILDEACAFDAARQAQEAVRVHPQRPPSREGRSDKCGAYRRIGSPIDLPITPPAPSTAGRGPPVDGRPETETNIALVGE